MNNFRKRKQRYLMGLPAMFLLLWLVSVFRWNDESDLFIFISLVSLFGVSFLSVSFYMINKIIDDSKIIDVELYRIIKHKVITSLTVLGGLSLIGCALNDAYALFLTVFSIVLSMNVFALVCRRGSQQFKSSLYSKAPRAYSKKIVDFFVGEIEWGGGIGSKVGDINPATGLPITDAGYDSHGNASASSGFDVASTASSDSVWDSYNPANGTPMVSPGYDMYGNMYGTSDTSGTSHSGFSDSDYNR
ncbi:hypothetical protein [Scandinavium goeteborgense]|uniref:Uncharacterized protein n=1 Tax=Scandinavium goeteborgense TaxID=1851514 RepID=A0A4R6E1C7_SCAGO|nr:hypothetical protein [Scandinavium goeteborgense]TDN51483.1 hypothetical protein EC847_11812 [Scandinavium goeteborgense]